MLDEKGKGQIPFPFLILERRLPVKLAALPIQVYIKPLHPFRC